MAETDQKQTVEKGERQLHSKRFAKFKGVNTQNSRNATPEDNFYDLTNLIPVGAGNLHTVADISVPLVNYGIDVIYWYQYACINATDYQILFATDGKVFAYNIGTNASVQINTGGGQLFSGSGSRCDQWKNNVVVFADANGYFYWDGTTFTGPVSNAGNILPTPPFINPDIAVYANYVWLYVNRLLYVGAINSYTDFTVASGALIQALTDPQIRGQLTRMLSANGYLYLVGRSSISVVSDVYVPASASPPAPIFTITNLQATTGSDQPASVMAYNRSLLFANRYGLWSLTGSSAERLSKEIDGTIQYLDITQPVCTGQCVVQNIPHAAFLFKQVGDPIFGSRTIIGMFLDGKWWFANYGLLTFIAWGLYNNVPTLFGMIGNILYRLFDNTQSAPASSWKTPLWPMEDAIATKEVQRVGYELSATNIGGVLSFYVDTPNTSTLIPSNVNTGAITFLNNLGQPLTWLNNMGQPITFFNSSFVLAFGDGQGAYAKYVGISGNAGQGSIYELDSFIMDYYLRNRWS